MVEKQAHRLWALDAPMYTGDAGEVVLGDDSGVTVHPVPAFLIEHERGLVLFDTSLDYNAAGDPFKVFGDMAEKYAITYTIDQRIDNQLESIGFRPEDVTHVILSHGHFDHTGGCLLFPTAKFFTTIEELRYAFWPDPAQHDLFNRDALEAMRGFDWRLMSGDLDLFGDGSIQILRAPGHTPGSSALLVRLESSSFLLTGDVVHLRSAWTRGVQMPLDWNSSESVRSIKRLQQIADAHQAEVWIGHDPVDWARFKHAPEWYS
jgi:N-acyl homoserine lactone hydrolase